MVQLHKLITILMLGFITLASTSCSREFMKIDMPELQAVSEHDPSVQSSGQSLIETGDNTSNETGDEDSPKQSIIFSPTPAVPRLNNLPEHSLSEVAPDEDPATLQLNLEGIPLASFINQVYGEMLGYSFELDKALHKRTDLVTLRLSKPVNKEELGRIVEQVLANYGVGITPQGDLLRFGLKSKSTGLGEPPLLFSGRAMPDVPPTHRPIFQFVPLKVVRADEVEEWLKLVYAGHNLEVLKDKLRNSVVLVGAPGIVSRALRAISVLDQPMMSGRSSVRIEPVFWEAIGLAKQLEVILKTEGYHVSTSPQNGNIILLPVQRNNVIFAFAPDQKTLLHVKEWAKNLDRPGREPGRKGLFIYKVKNTDAAGLEKTLTPLLGSLSGSSKTVSGKKKRVLNRSVQQRLMVDAPRNALIYRGNKLQWNELLPIIRQLDQPSRQVLIEVTVAEITLSDNVESGVEWLIQGAGIDRFEGVAQTLGGLGVGSSGLSYTLQSGGQVRAVINAFASSSRISVLSTPRIMVRSGSEATIDVGTEIPVITSQSVASDLLEGGTSSILQEVQYRKTGNLLRVRPIVYAGRRVDIEITQEISQAQPNQLSGIDSPTILNRIISTTLSVVDGGSVLLGGLVSKGQNAQTNKVPLLGDLPFLGKLFRSDSTAGERTEVVMLITPYIAENQQESEEITAIFLKSLQP